MTLLRYAGVKDSGDTWDVFVVGVRDNSHASTVMLAAELSHYTGMPTSEVELALMKGEVRVRAGLARTEAENAALDLDDRGAIVDLRLSDGKSGVFPILKPDASRRSGTAVGGFIDDSATPPSLADTSGLQTLPLEPDHEDGLPPPPPPSPNFETLEDIASEPIRVGSRRTYRGDSDDLLGAVENLVRQGESALGHVDEHTGHAGPGDKQIVDVPRQRSPDSVPPLFSRASAAPEWTTDPPSRPNPIPASPPTARRSPSQTGIPAAGHAAPSPTPAPMPGATAPPAAYAPPGYPHPGMHPGMHPGAYGAPAPAMPPGYPAMAPHPTPPPTAVPVPTAVPTPTPTPAPPPSASGSSPGLEGLSSGLDNLEVTDLPTAFKAKKPKKKKRKKKPTAELPASDSGLGREAAPERRAPRPDPSASSSLELDFEAAGISPKNKKLKQLGGRITGEHRPDDAELPRRTRAGNMGGTGGAAYGRPQQEEATGEFILGADVTTALPLGLAIGLGVGLATALVLQRGASHEKLEPLEQEMLMAATNPDTAGAGDLRSASQVEKDLDEAYGSLKNRFLLQWLGIGIPLGLVLSRIPRRQG